MKENEIEKKIIAYSYYLIQKSGFCNMLDFHCVMKTASNMRLYEFVKHYNHLENPVGEVMSQFTTEMIVGYEQNVENWIDNDNVAYTDIELLRKERTELKKTDGRANKRAKKQKKKV